MASTFYHLLAPCMTHPQQWHSAQIGKTPAAKRSRRLKAASNRRGSLRSRRYKKIFLILLAPHSNQFGRSFGVGGNTSRRTRTPCWILIPEGVDRSLADLHIQILATASYKNVIGGLLQVFLTPGMRSCLLEYRFLGLLLDLFLREA